MSKFPGKNIIKNPSKTTTKITGKKNGSKTSVKENDGGSCGVDSLDLFIINQKFSDLYEKAKGEHLDIYNKNLKLGFDPDEFRQSLLEGGKRNEMDIKANGDLYATMGDDTIEFNPTTITAPAHSKLEFGATQAMILSPIIFPIVALESLRKTWRGIQSSSRSKAITYMHGEVQDRITSPLEEGRY